MIHPPLAVDAEALKVTSSQTCGDSGCHVNSACGDLQPFALTLTSIDWDRSVKKVRTTIRNLDFRMLSPFPLKDYIVYGNIRIKEEYSRGVLNYHCLPVACYTVWFVSEMDKRLFMIV